MSSTGFLFLHNLLGMANRSQLLLLFVPGDIVHKTVYKGVGKTFIPTD